MSNKYDNKFYIYCKTNLIIVNRRIKMLFIFPRLHEEAYRQLKEWKIEGEYYLIPYYESLNRSLSRTTLSQRVEEFLRRTFKQPSRYSLYGHVSDIIVAGERVPVHKGDLAELTLSYHPELGNEFTYQGILSRLEFDLDNLFHLEIDTNANKNGSQRFFDPHLYLRCPTLCQIRSIKMITNPSKKELLPIHVRDSGIMP